MAMLGAWWRFDGPPPSMQAIQARFNGRCGARCELAAVTAAGATLRALGGEVDLEVDDDGGITVLWGPGVHPYITTQVMTALRDLGGVRVDPRGAPTTSVAPPPWMTEPWPSLSRWRRLDVRARPLRNLATLVALPVIIPVAALASLVRGADRRSK